MRERGRREKWCFCEYVCVRARACVCMCVCMCACVRACQWCAPNTIRKLINYSHEEMNSSSRQSYVFP